MAGSKLVLETRWKQCGDQSSVLGRLKVRCTTAYYKRYHHFLTWWDKRLVAGGGRIGCHVWKLIKQLCGQMAKDPHALARLGEQTNGGDAGCQSGGVANWQ